MDRCLSSWVRKNLIEVGATLSGAKNRCAVKQVHDVRCTQQPFVTGQLADEAYFGVAKRQSTHLFGLRLPLPSTKPKWSMTECWHALPIMTVPPCLPSSPMAPITTPGRRQSYTPNIISKFWPHPGEIEGTHGQKLYTKQLLKFGGALKRRSVS